MPAISDLRRPWQSPRYRFSITAATITSDRVNSGLMPEPGFRRRGLTMRQQDNRLTALKIAGDRAVAVIAPLGEVVDADYVQWFARRLGASPDHAEQCVVANRQQHPGGKARSGLAAQGEAEVLDNMVEALGPP